MSMSNYDSVTGTCDMIVGEIIVTATTEARIILFPLGRTQMPNESQT